MKQFCLNKNFIECTKKTKNLKKLKIYSFYFRKFFELERPKNIFCIQQMSPIHGAKYIQKNHIEKLQKIFYLHPQKGKQRHLHPFTSASLLFVTNHLYKYIWVQIKIFYVNRNDKKRKDIFFSFFLPFKKKFFSNFKKQKFPLEI